MTKAVEELLRSFDALTEAEQHEAGMELLRRIFAQTAFLTDDALTEIAEARFLDLDASETADKPA